MSVHHRPSLLSLIFYLSFATVGALLYAPALPGIAGRFGISSGAAQFTVTLFLVGYMIGGLPYGPISNVLGRRRTIWVGASLGVVGSILCIVSDVLDAFWLMGLGRFISALGMAVGLVMAFTLIGDSYPGREGRKMVSKVVVAFALMPGFGVIVGGFLTSLISWQACFYFLVLYCGFIGWLSYRMVETAPAQRGSLHLVVVGRQLRVQFRNPLVVVGGLMMGCTTGAIYVFSSKSPFIGISLIGLTPDEYGLLFFVPMLGILIGSMVGNYLTHHLGEWQEVILGIVIMGLSGLVMLVAFLLDVVDVWTLFFPAMFFYVGGMLQYIAVSSAITHRAEDRSNAAAVMSFVNIGLATLGVLLAGLIFPSSAVALPIILVALVLAVTVLAFVLHAFEQKTS